MPAVASKFCYDVVIARALGDVHAAIYLEALYAREVFPGATVICSAAEVAADTGLTEEAAQKARKVLQTEGCIAITGRHGKQTGHIIQQEQVEHFITANVVIVEHEDREEAAVVEVFTSSILEGDFDGLPPRKAFGFPGLLDALLRLWASTFAKRDNPKLTVERKRAFKRLFVDENRKASEIARAIIGMGEDDWEGRAEYCDIPHVARSLDRWIELYEAVRAGTRPKRERAPGLRGKVVRGVLVPHDYVWTREDDAALDFGHLFDPLTRKWVSRDAKL